MQRWIMPFSHLKRSPMHHLRIKAGALMLLLGTLLSITLSWPTMAQAHSTTISKPQNAASRQTQAVTTAHRIDVFARGSDGMLWHRGGSAAFNLSSWESLGVPIDSAPSVITDPSNNSLLDVFYNYHFDIVNLLFDPVTHWMSKETLSDHCEHSFGGFCTVGFASAPTAVSGVWGSERLDVFALTDADAHDSRSAASHKMYHLWTDENGWTDEWSKLSTANFLNDPSAISPFSGHLDLFIRSFDNQVYDKVYDQGRWTLWQSRGGNVTSSPSASLVHVGSNAAYLVVARSASGGIAEAEKLTDGEWLPWKDLDNSMVIVDAPAVINDNQSLDNWDIFARGPDYKLWVKQDINGHWVAWNPLGGGQITTSPAAVSWTYTHL